MGDYCGVCGAPGDWAERVRAPWERRAEGEGWTRFSVFEAGAVSAAKSTVTATSPVVADGVAASAIVVRALDTEGNTVSGVGVTLSVTPPGAGAVLTQSAGVTDGSGEVGGSLRSTTTGVRVVRAVIDGMGAVRAIAEATTGSGDKPVEDVVISKISIIDRE